ncbi:hypothetical protein BGZ96_006063 [Linnemannia gamsii]|uniref:F-box domain-containing protein n=1 Tax=Linnemannia gamsii TaxID=64522 RepID=A0ABQ7K2Y3_9FUNG|nr:hypothetical protein BGZ96_006063 [Linnemannia gamsii]
MATILNLPDEIHLLIAEHLETKTVYSLIRICRSFYSSYIPCLWSNLTVQPAKGYTILEPVVRSHAHLIEGIYFSPYLAQDYYTIDFPRLRSLYLETFFGDKCTSCYSKGLLVQKLDFVRRHPFIKNLVYQHGDTVPREFWEVIVTEWTHLVVFNFSGIVKDDAQDAFWRVCDRVQTLRLSGVDLLLKNTSILSTLPFQRLRTLAVSKYSFINKFPYRAWPLQLLEQVKRSPILKRLEWSVSDTPFPVQRFQETLVEEGCWPTLCQLDINDSGWTDQDGAEMLRALPSRRLTEYTRTMGGKFGPLTFNCMREMCFGHLRNLTVRKCKGFTSVMAQEVLMECVHLVTFQAPHIFVRDIATAPKPWGCLQLKRLKIHIAKEPEDEAGWEGQVFEQIGRLGQLLYLNLERISRFSAGEDVDGVRPHSMETLDLRLPCSRLKNSSGTVDGVELGGGERGGGGNGSSERGANVTCWSHLVHLRNLAFHGDRQLLGMEEALWMTEHWKDLRSITGAFRAAICSDKEDLKRLFAKHSVIHFEVPL